MSPSQPNDSAQIRRTFLDFFAQRGHEVVPSAPLVPQNDPTLMFVNAGMVQFKDVFTGKDRRPYTRAASSQKCIRISGKHNDLENVGVTARHQTFFEMLGNFSFGDYFKEEAIVYAWDLLTKVYGVSPSRLIVTVYNGEGGFPKDDEAAAIWRKVTGFGEDRIRALGLADNFWTMGDTGPCGPCSEIHYFHGGEPDPSRFGEEPRIDGSGWTEIWNNVFMQYDRAEKDGPVVPLPAASVDTGMGLERIASVLQGVTSNYDTDLLRGLVDRAAELSGKRYTGSTSADDVSMRVIADHARTSAFLIAEGVMPERQKREYVLRRVMRRAIRHGHRLGIERPFLHEVALEVVRRMGDVYPELKDRRELIARVTEDEEVRFRATLKRGMKILDDRFGEMRSQGKTTLPAEAAADLYTTYGFPLDLTEVISAEQKFGVDVAGAEAIIHGAEGVEGPINPEAALDPAFREARALLKEPVVFTGYEEEAGDSEVVALIQVEGQLDHAEGQPDRTRARPKRTLVQRAEAGTRVEIVVSRTPFYAESGGQVGDAGKISAAGLRVEVKDTQKPLLGLVVHEGVVREGAIEVGQKVHLEVDHAARTATRRNHSATHVLHWALRKVLGEHAQQKGSRVGPDTLRFDFAHNKPVTAKEIEQIEDLVNAKILTNETVQTEVLSMDEAKKRGAMAIFEEKYGDTVRMLSMSSEVVELCGGTHAKALGDIGLFKIVGEAGVAAGVRRLFAETGLNALTHVRKLEGDIGRARQAARATGGDLATKIEKLVAHERELEKKVSDLERRLAEGGGPGQGSGGGIDGLLEGARDIGGTKVLARRVADGTSGAALREIAEKLRDKLGERSAVLLGSVVGDKAQLALMVSKAATDRLKAGEIIRPVAKLVGGSGGGRPDMAQAGGTEVGQLDAAIAAAYAEFERALG
ncbi:alanine--tRNA ligase [Chondromyces apiculatus]|uniref:Alanine--tRNA ligase n=1 Tax=Chondromyces apiculatus DSM 436 TaxID=1192034 RepID=A0A017TEJ6_9BACT|nr:alanine--tRNA ligase [Chondromyces apiculatus]EYF07011.1 Alanyl-tRNA synthetase [Chondromyces apiculatus DSM 436]